MKLAFTKMHGIGNDFVVIDAMDRDVPLDGDAIRLLADRHYGVGCDQVLVLQAPDDPDSACRYRVFNADGREAEHCGNGVRCIGRFLRDTGRTDADRFFISGLAGRIELQALPDDRFRVAMGVPVTAPDPAWLRSDEPGPSHTLEAAGRDVRLDSLSLGNPHAVITVDDVDAAPVAELGPALDGHAAFPAGVNVGFMAITARDAVRLRVHERGAGETLACGSGACAAVVAGRLNGTLDERVSVSLPGGILVIEWKQKGEPVWMTGPATPVFEGVIEL